MNDLLDLRGIAGLDHERGSHREREALIAAVTLECPGIVMHAPFPHDLKQYLLFGIHPFSFDSAQKSSLWLNEPVPAQVSLNRDHLKNHFPILRRSSLKHGN